MEEIYRKIDELKDEMVEVLKNLIRIEAIAPQSGGKGEWEKAEYIESLIKNFGFDKIERHDCLDPKAMHGYRPNIVAEVKGKIKEKIWLVTHMDVVPPGDLKKWNTNPFEPVVKDGKIYGRGSEDNGQDIVSTIYAVKAMRSLGISPENTLGIVIGSDEETGSEKGIKYLLNKGLFKDASGVIVPDGGNADGTLIEIAEKSIMWLKFIVEGKQSHGSMPDKGINAFKAGMRLGLELDKELYKKYKFEDKLFSPPLSTFEPTKKEENVPNINTIPGEDIFYMDCRILPKYPVDKVFSTIEKVKKKIEKERKVKIKIEKVHEEKAAPPTKKDCMIVKKLMYAVKEVHKNRPYTGGIGGGTYAALFRKAGIDAVVWSKVDNTCHMPNEYAKIDNIVKGAKVYATLLLKR